MCVPRAIVSVTPGSAAQYHQRVEPGATVQAGCAQQMVPHGERVKAEFLGPAGHLFGDAACRLVVQTWPRKGRQGQAKFHAPSFWITALG